MSFVLSRTTERFRSLLTKLPKPIQDKAASAYAVWTANPDLPALRFNKVHDTRPIYSVRIGRSWRPWASSMAARFTGSGLAHSPTMRHFSSTCEPRPNPGVNTDGPPAALRAPVGSPASLICLASYKCASTSQH